MRCSCKELYRTDHTVAIVHDVNCRVYANEVTVKTATSVLVCALKYCLESDANLTFSQDVVAHLKAVWNQIPYDTRKWMLREVKQRLWQRKFPVPFGKLFEELVERDKESPDPVDD